MEPLARADDRAFNWQEFNLEREPEPTQLDDITIRLELVMLALVALTGAGSESLVEVAEQLNLNSVIADRLTHPENSQQQKPLSVDEARALVLIICYLAKENQALIRRAIALLEQYTTTNEDLRQVGLLRDYFDAFSQMYQEQIDGSVSPSSDPLNPLAIKLLIELLFYSNSNSPQRFWLALLSPNPENNP
ncbi:DUF3038 domain-containing protein [Capilliphycus salinus ALCB114379]|uniref:DUF3038 domain-containing protein n=1 Tax=Capilliphycus salinus TaxID=2768948 RepID=UPI0039A72581